MSETQRKTIAAGILAGGQSSRMGSPKEGILLWDHRPMLSHVIGNLKTVCDTVVILGDCRGWTPEEDAGIVHLPDIHPGLGPLGGIETLLDTGIADAYLVVSCDQPLISPELFRQLTVQPPETLSFFRGETGEPLDPLPGLYPAGLLGAVRQALLSENRALRKFIGEFSVQWVEISPEAAEQLVSINTPQVLEAVIQAKRSEDSKAV